MGKLIDALRSIIEDICMPSWPVVEHRGDSSILCTILVHRDALALKRGHKVIAFERYPVVSVFARLGRGVDLSGSQKRVWFVSFAGRVMKCRSKQDAMAIERKAEDIRARAVKVLDGKPLSALGDF